MASVESTTTPAGDGRIYLSPELEEDLQRRLDRIEGQVQDVRAMMDEREACEDLLIQLGTVKVSLDQVTFRLLDGHVGMCVTKYMDTGDIQALERLTKALTMVVKKA